MSSEPVNKNLDEEENNSSLFQTTTKQLSHKKWRALIKKQKRKLKRQSIAKNEEELEEQQLSPTTITRQTFEQKQQEIKEKYEENLRLALHEKWLQREVEARDRFIMKKKWDELEKQKRLEEEARIRKEWEEREKQEEIERLEKEKENEERQKKKKKQEELLKEATRNQKNDDGPWRNPEAPVLLPGIERETCPFFKKVGACRFGERCSRGHPYPESSTTILLPGFYSNFKFNMSIKDECDKDIGLEIEDSDTYQHFKEFYRDTLPEFENFGNVIQFKVCANYEAHLRGNVYVEYDNESDALAAQMAFNGRWYAKRRISCELANIEKWKNAICGVYSRNICPKGKTCNFLHCFRNPGNAFWQRDYDMVLSPVRDHRNDRRSRKRKHLRKRSRSRSHSRSDRRRRRSRSHSRERYSSSSRRSRLSSSRHSKTKRLDKNRSKSPKDSSSKSKMHLEKDRGKERSQSPDQFGRQKRQKEKSDSPHSGRYRAVSPAKKSDRRARSRSPSDKNVSRARSKSPTDRTNRKRHPYSSKRSVSPNIECRSRSKSPKRGHQRNTHSRSRSHSLSPERKYTRSNPRSKSRSLSPSLGKSLSKLIRSVSRSPERGYGHKRSRSSSPKSRGDQLASHQKSNNKKQHSRKSTNSHSLVSATLSSQSSSSDSCDEVTPFPSKTVSVTPPELTPNVHAVPEVTELDVSMKFMDTASESEGFLTPEETSDEELKLLKLNALQSMRQRKAQKRSSTASSTNTKIKKHKKKDKKHKSVKKHHKETVSSNSKSAQYEDRVTSSIKTTPKFYHAKPALTYFGTSDSSSEDDDKGNSSDEGKAEIKTKEAASKTTQKRHTSCNNFEKPANHENSNINTSLQGTHIIDTSEGDTRSIEQRSVRSVVGDFSTDKVTDGQILKRVGNKERALQFLSNVISDIENK